MDASLLLVDYVRWHYTRAFRDIGATWLNIAWFVTHFFSMPLLLRTFFSPWKRVTEEYHKKGIEALASTFLVNTLSRLIGICVRLVILVMGVATLLITVLGLIVFLVVWIVLPLVSVMSLIGGLKLLFV